MADEQTEPGETVLANLRFLASGEAATLQKIGACAALQQLLREELNIDDNVSPDRLVGLLRKILIDIVSQAQRRALTNILSQQQSDADTLTISAAGELLGLTDSDTFGRFRREVKIDDVQWETQNKHRDYRSAKRKRQLRASVWQGKFSYAGPQQNEAKWLATLELAFRLYLHDATVAPKLPRSLSDFEPWVSTDDGFTGEARGRSKDEESTLTPDGVKHFPSDTYVRRDLYHDEFGRLVSDGADCIVLVGLPGVGKTWLADALVGDHLPEGSVAPQIGLTNGRVDSVDIQVALSSVGVHTTPEQVLNNPRMYLADLLSGEHAPPFVIIDGADNFRQVDRLLPKRTKSTVVVNCRSIGHTRRRHSVVWVGYMDEAETKSVVKAQLPTISDKDASLLAASLHGYPLLVRYVCGLLANQPTPIDRFCSEIGSEIVRVASDIEADQGSTLSTVLRKSTILVRAENALAYEILICLCHIDSSRGVVRKFVRNYLLAKGVARVTDIDLMAAIDVLQRFSLLDSRLSRRSSSALIIHSLTRGLVRQIFTPHSSDVAATALIVYQRMVTEFRERLAAIDLHEDELDLDVMFPTIDPTATTASEIYAQFLLSWRQGDYILRMTPLARYVQQIQDTLRTHPSKRLGTLAVTYAGPEIPVRIVDMDADGRPTEGEEVEIFGHRFPLMDKE